MTLLDWMFEHPWLTTFIALAVVEAMAAPFRWQRGSSSDAALDRDDDDRGAQ